MSFIVIKSPRSRPGSGKLAAAVRSKKHPRARVFFPNGAAPPLGQFSLGANNESTCLMNAIRYNDDRKRRLMSLDQEIIVDGLLMFAMRHPDVDGWVERMTDTPRRQCGYFL